MATAWYRYGRVTARVHDHSLLHQFMPRCDVVERHKTTVEAPADITYQAARAMDLNRSRLVRAIFRGRELLMRADHPEPAPRQPLIDEVLALGWGVLAEEPGREIVLGAVTRPWEANVTFRALRPSEFVMFDEPGYVKIAWNLRVEPIGTSRSVFHTETRVVTTDAYAARRFRRYWAVFSAGIRLIRGESLRLVKREAEESNYQ
ncbi:MAG TPA: hypothetical protein VJ596_10170, partial [Gemmatimonadaceae bacterium]|nr:hypothetical protein [Gemmatimonadaceae bacterium]